MRKWFSSFWENYKYRFVPWIIVNLKQKKNSSAITSQQNAEVPTGPQHSQLKHAEEKGEVTSTGSMIVHHVHQGDDKFLSDDELVNLLVHMFRRLLENEKGNHNMNDDQAAEKLSRTNKDIMHSVFGYSIERRKSMVGEHAGTGVFLASGNAKPGSLIALYPGTIYMPSEALFFQSLGNPFIFRCSDNVHIDGNDKWLSRSVYKSCAARDRFGLDFPCCDESWLTTSPINPLNVGQYVNNRSKTQVNNVVYQESQIIFDCDGDKKNSANAKNSSNLFPVKLAKYLPNLWSNPDNNHHPLRLVPLIAVNEIKEGDEILSSYFTLVHTNNKISQETEK